MRPVATAVLILLVSMPARAAGISFMRDVAPILLKRCTGCHGELKQSGRYRAHTFADLMKPGESDERPVVAGKPEQSQLYKLIAAHDEVDRMPQKDDALSPEQIAIVRRWIATGARFDGGDRAAALKTLLPPRQHPASPAVYGSAVPVMALAFGPGGKELFVGGYHEATVWNPSTGALVRRLPSLPQRTRALVFSKDGKTLLVAGGTPGEYGEVALVDPTTGRRRKVLDTFDDIVLAAAYSADGKRIAAGGADANVRVYDAATGRRLWSKKMHADWVTSVSFSADGRFLASASKDMTVKVYQASDGALFTTYSGHNKNFGKYKGQAAVYAVQFASDGPLAFSAGGGQAIHIWDPVKAAQENGTAADMEERFSKQGHARYLDHGFTLDVLAMLVRDGQVFAASADGMVKQFDLATQKPVRTFQGHRDWVLALAHDPGSNRVATGSHDGQVRVWNAQDGHAEQSVVAFVASPGFRGDTTAAAAPP